MTDTDTTIAGEVAAAVRILRDISETLRSIDTSPICHDPHDYGQPLNPREGAVLASSGAKAPTVGTGKEEPEHEFRVGDRVVVSLDAKTVSGGGVYFGVETTGTIVRGPSEEGSLFVEARNSDGDLIKQRVSPEWLTLVEESAPDEKTPWPTERGLYWVRGMDGSKPVEGVAHLADSAPNRKFTFVDGSDSIWERFGTDRLTECVPLTCVPTALLERLYDASPDSYGRANEAIHDLEQWTTDHKEAGR